MESTLLAGLNAAQRAAVTSPAHVLQVLAPPGSGKTKTLTTRVAYHLSHHGYAPQNIICCTFTIKAAREMRERLRGLVGELEQRLVLGTFHSICRRYLVSYGRLIGIPKGFGIADSSDSQSIIKRIVKRLGLNIDPKAARSKISAHKARGKTLQDLKPPNQEKDAVRLRDIQEFQTVFHEYEAALQTSNLLDYDDLLLRCADLLKAHGECVSNVEALLIDEFQDTNIVQFELMKLLSQHRRRVTIVGDPDQSIYGFRSAEIENLRRMQTFYPDTVVINLEENYRSSSAVLNLAQDVIEQDTERPDKKLKSTHCYGTLPVLRRLPNPHEEALWLASEVKRTLAMTGGLLQHSDVAVLLRSAYLSLLIEKAFTASGIPYRMVGGMRFFDRVEIRIVIEYLRTISHPDNDAALLGIINTPSRKIGEAVIGALVKLGQERGISVWSVVQKVLTGQLTPEKKPTKPATEDLQKLVSLIKQGRQKLTSLEPKSVPSKLIEFVVSSVGLPAYLQKKYKDDHADRMENIQELVNHASEVASMSPMEEQLPAIEGTEQQELEGGQEALDQFLANIVLSSEVQTDDKGDETPRVTISTIHSAKGLEWPVVFVPAVYEGSIPHSRAENTDEERRLLYVAMTRAQALLTLTFPVLQTRDYADSVLTQFLPNDVLPRVRERGPSFDDNVVSSIATILHRCVPSQEELVKGRQSLGDKDSAEDDIWPYDGSRRSELYEFSATTGDFHATSRIVNGTSLEAGFGQRASYSTMSTATTMNNLSTFSTANTSIGFVSAREFKANQPAQPVQQPSSGRNSQPEQVRPSKSSSGKIAGFFIAKGPAPKAVNVDKQTPSIATNSSMAPEPTLPSIPNVPRKFHSSTCSTIPTELSSHKLGKRLNSISSASTLKRPRSALEPTDSNTTKQQRYVFLSSSPPPEVKSENEQNENAAIHGRPKQSSNPLSRLDGFGEHRQPSHQSKQNTPIAVPSVAKAYGIRRSMNGWDARKHK